MMPRIKGMLGRATAKAVRLSAVGTPGPSNRQSLPPRMTSVVDMVSQHMLAVNGVSRVTIDTVGMGPPDTVRVSAYGWSPSLHGVGLKLTTRVDLSRGADSVAEQILIQIASALAIQHRRAAAAATLTGRVEPLDTGHAVDLDHVHVDVSLDGLCQTAGYTLRSQLPAVVRRIHGAISDHDGGMIHATNVGFVGERPEETMEGQPMVREAGLMIPYDASGDRPGFIYDGVTLSIDAPPVPETMATMLPGRPLADLVMLHPALDGRVIREIEQNDEKRHRITVRLVRELMRFRDLAL